MRTFTIFALVLSVIMMMSTSAGAQAIAEGEFENARGDGFVTLAHRETGQQILVYCESGLIHTIVFIDDDRPVTIGTSIGTKCLVESLPGFEAVINLDPRDGGWVLTPGQLWATPYGVNHAKMAYACTYNGAAFAVKHPGEEMYVFSRSGSCAPGVYPG